MTLAKLRLTQATMAKRETKVRDLLRRARPSAPCRVNSPAIFA